MKTSLYAAVAVSAVLAAGSASAITYTVLDAPLPPNNEQLDAGPPNVYESIFGAGNVGFGLVQSAEAFGDDTNVAFEFFAEQSGFTNDFEFTFAGLSVGETNAGPVIYTLGANTFSGDNMEFVVTDENGCNCGAPADASLGDIGFGIFYDLTGSDDTLYLAFSDRATSGDSDYDDLVIKTSGDVSVVPIPAAGFLLLGGLGGLAALRRRKKAA